MRERIKRGGRGQSTLEYLLVLAAVLFAIIAIVGTTIRPGVERTITESNAAINNAADRLLNRMGLE
jgi:uncharacterized protein (UPF0333 family)